MRAIDSYTEAQIETLRLKRMLPSTTPKSSGDIFTEEKLAQMEASYNAHDIDGGEPL